MTEYKLGKSPVKTFDTLTKEETSAMMKEVGALLDKCEGCPLQAYGAQAEFEDVEDRLVLCGACKVFDALRERGDKLYGHDMTKRQLAILNKGVDMTGAEIEELFLSGVQKQEIARTMGYNKADNSGFKTICRKKGVVLESVKDLTPESIEETVIYATIG